MKCPQGRRWTRLGSSLLVATGIGLAAVATVPASPQAPPSPVRGLRVVAEYAVPAVPSVATSVRWASDQTVYLARFADGVFEVTLDDKLSQVRVVLPNAKTMKTHFASFSKLAASSAYVAASSWVSDFAFRPIITEVSGAYLITHMRVGILTAFDLFGGRLLYLGQPETGPHTSSGVVWIGTLSGNPEKDLSPILHDAAAAGAATTPALIKCQTLPVGAARFLADGSFVVVPGFQSGVHLYGPDARLLRTWQNEELGFDTPDCSGMSPEEAKHHQISAAARLEFLNLYRVVDEILPLPQGRPGLVIRSVRNGKVQWVMRVPQMNGDVLGYDLPMTGVGTDRLRGDVRGGKIVLLRTGMTTAKDVPDPPGRLYVLEAPQGAVVGR